MLAVREPVAVNMPIENCLLATLQRDEYEHLLTNLELIRFSNDRILLRLETTYTALKENTRCYGSGEKKTTLFHRKIN